MGAVCILVAKAKCLSFGVLKGIFVHLRYGGGCWSGGVAQAGYLHAGCGAAGCLPISEAETGFLRGCGSEAAALRAGLAAAGRRLRRASTAPGASPRVFGFVLPPPRLAAVWLEWSWLRGVVLADDFWRLAPMSREAWTMTFEEGATVALGDAKADI
jgi:hypothetical protein